MARQSPFFLVVFCTTFLFGKPAWGVQHRTLVGELNREDSTLVPPIDDGDENKESEGQRGGQDLMNNLEVYKGRGVEEREGSHSELDEEFHGGSQRDEFVRRRIMEKLLSLPNLLHFSFPPAPGAPGPGSNYANEKTQNPPPLLQHFLSPRESSGVGENGQRGGQGRDPLSTSVNQLLRSIYEHQGRGGEQFPPPPPRPYPPPLRYYFREGKRSGSNSGYICHFKLCQFGSSGKRLYKPHSRFNIFEKNEM